MADIVSNRSCPHCGSRLKKWLVPDGSSWGEAFFHVCFNDACSYYMEGWDWMEKHYKHKVSHRCAINPRTGSASPLPVWSDSATREMIVEDAEGGDE